MNNKRLITAALAVSMLFSAYPAAHAADETEYIYNEVYLLNKNEYSSAAQSFTMLDLKEYANRDFKDDVEGDHMGGWSDQGNNDLRDFTMFGVQKFYDVPFNIIDPGSNDGKSVLVLRGQGETVLPYKVEIPVNQTARGAYFLHTTAYGMGEGTEEAQYTFVYEDGTSAAMHLLDQVHLRDFWGAGDYDYYRTAWSQKRTSDNQLISFGIFALSNPHPEKVIKSIVLETSNQGGGAYVMILGITLTSGGPYLPDIGEYDPINPPTVNWIRTAGERDVISGSPLDNTFFLDAPAGKHGKLLSEGNGFVFEDGTPAKFWGVNLNFTDSFKDPGICDKTVEGIAKCGYNLVRFDDLPQNISAEQEKILAYLIEKFMEKGIYTYICVNNSHNIADFFSPQSIVRQKNDLKRLLEIRLSNGETLAECGGVVMLEFIGSCSLLDYSAGMDTDFLGEDEDKQLLKQLFNEWLAKKYIKTTELKKAWEVDGVAVNEWETLEKQSVELPGWWKYSLYTKQRKQDIREFLAYLQTECYNQLKDYALSIGFKNVCTMNSNNWEKNSAADSYMNSGTDFTARNIVWANPYGSRRYGDKAWIYKYDSMLKDDRLGIVGEAAASDYANTPLVISEWAYSVSDPYFSEGSLMLAAFSAKQGWNPITYTYMQEKYSDENKLSDFYSVYNNPVNRTLAVSAARVFFATDRISRQKNVSVSRADVFSSDDVIGNSEFLNADASIEVCDKNMNTPKSALALKNNDGTIFTDREKGLFMLDSEGAQAVTGFKNGEFDLTNISYNIDNHFSTVILTSNNGKKITDSDSLLLSAVGAVRNSAMQYNGNVVKNVGTAPVIVEAITGTVKLRLPDEWKIYALSEKGERMEEIQYYKNSNGEIVFNINKYYQKKAQKSYNFEIVRRRK